MLHVRAFARIALVIPALAGARSTHAQAPTPVSWSVRAENVGVLKTGAEVVVTVTAAIEPGWHIYSLTQKPGGPIALSISVPAGEPFVLARSVTGPKPEIQADATLDVPIELYSGAAEFPVPLRLTTTSPSGVLDGRIATRFQVCSNTTCLPPRTITLPVRLQQRNSGGAR